MHKVMLIRSHHVGWNTVRDVVESIDDAQVIADVRIARRAETHARHEHPNIVIAGEDVEGRESLPVLMSIREILGPQAQFIMLTGKINRAQLLSLERLRLSGLLRWRDVPLPAMPHYLRAAMDSDVTIISRTLLDAWYEARVQRASQDDLIEQVTPRERETLELMAAGQTIEEIAQVLQVSSRTTRRDITSLMEKLDSGDRFALGVQAIRLGLIM